MSNSVVANWTRTLQRSKRSKWRCRTVGTDHVVRANAQRNSVSLASDIKGVVTFRQLATLL
jgi:hypothetical protein